MHDFADVWGIHCERDESPVLVGWAPSEKEAQRRLEELRAQGGAEFAGAEFWVVRMTRSEVDDFKEAGVLPKDA